MLRRKENERITALHKECSEKERDGRSQRPSAGDARKVGQNTKAAGKQAPWMTPTGDVANCWAGQRFGWTGVRNSRAVDHTSQPCFQDPRLFNSKTFRQTQEPRPVPRVAATRDGHCRRARGLLYLDGCLPVSRSTTAFRRASLQRRPQCVELIDAMLRAHCEHENTSGPCPSVEPKLGRSWSPGS
jgi:hypothetical protein